MKKTKMLSTLLAGVAVMSLASCSDDNGGAPVNPDGPRVEVPEGYAAVNIKPLLNAPGRGMSGVATTANLKDFDFVVSFPDEPAGAGTIKGRWDNVSHTVYSTNTGGSGTGALILPKNKKFVITAMAAGHQNASGVYADGGMINYEPDATGTVDLKNRDGGIVQDYILATSAETIATDDHVTVPITFNHQTSKVIISAEVVSDRDFMVCMDPRVILTGEKDTWNISNVDGSFTASGADNAREFLLKPRASSTMKSTSCFDAFRTYLQDDRVIYLTNKDGEQNLMWGATDQEMTHNKWGALENARQLFWWPGQYTQTSLPAFSGNTFQGGCSMILNFQAYSCVYDASGLANPQGINYTPENSIANLSTNSNIALGKYAITVPVDLATGLRKLDAGKAYKLKIRFFSGDGPQPNPYYSNVTIEPSVVDWQTGEEYNVPN